MRADEMEISLLLILLRMGLTGLGQERGLNEHVNESCDRNCTVESMSAFRNDAKPEMIHC